jgi:NAD-dependent deacetylase
MLAIGSSLVVYPAGGLPLLARDCGATFLILNRGETGLDDEADERFDADAGSVLSRLAMLLARKAN